MVVVKYVTIYTSIGIATSQTNTTSLTDFIMNTSLANWEIAFMTSHKHLSITIKTNLFTTRVTKANTRFHHFCFMSLWPLASQCMMFYMKEHKGDCWFIFKRLSGWCHFIYTLFCSHTKSLVIFTKGTFNVCCVIDVKGINIWIYCWKYKEGFGWSMYVF